MTSTVLWGPGFEGPGGEEGWSRLLHLGHARLVARSRTTRTERGTLDLPGGAVPVHRKSYDYSGLGDRVRGLFRTTFAARGRARREWEALERLLALGAPPLAPPPVAVAERRSLGVLHASLLATLSVEDGRDLGDRRPEPGLAAAVGTAAGRMHAAGLGSLSLSPRNLVAARAGDGAWTVVKVDTGRIREVARGGAAQALDLAVLLAGLEGRWPPEALAELRAAYAAAAGGLPGGLDAVLPAARAAVTRRAAR